MSNMSMNEKLENGKIEKDKKSKRILDLCRWNRYLDINSNNEEGYNYVLVIWLIT